MKDAVLDLGIDQKDAVRDLALETRIVETERIKVGTDQTKETSVMSVIKTVKGGGLGQRIVAKRKGIEKIVRKDEKIAGTKNENQKWRLKLRKSPSMVSFLKFILNLFTKSCCKCSNLLTLVSRA